MIVNALRTGVMEGNGKHYQQPRIEIRPRPKYSFDNRIYAVASSEDSVEAAARLGAHMVMFSDRPWPMRLPAIQRNRELHRKFHGSEAPTMLIADFCICWPKLDEAEELARKHMGSFVHSNFEHYELLGDHFNTVKGYDAYAQKAAIAEGGGHGRRDRRVHEGGGVGDARPHPARTRGAARGDRRVRTGYCVPLRRHSVQYGGEVAAAVRQGGAAGAAKLDRGNNRQRGSRVMSDELLYRLENRVAVLTLNRPERLNALTRDMMQALLARLSACAVDDAIGCVVLTGAGGAFCAGGDVRAQARVAAEGTTETPERRTDLLRASMEASRLLHEMPKPTIAMLNGVAAGAGMSLALACDLRIAGATRG